MTEPNLYYIVVSATYRGIITSVELFDSYTSAVGYAQTKYGNGDELLDETIVYEVSPPEDVGRPVYHVEMQAHNPTEDEDFEVEEIKRGPSNLSIPNIFKLVDVHEIYDKKTLPSVQKVSSLKAGSIVQIAVATQDSHEKCLVVIDKIYKRYIKGQRKNRKKLVRSYKGRLMGMPETFSPPNDMKVVFASENILAVGE